MKNIFYALLLFSVMAHGQIVNIPDVNFKARLLLANTNNQIAANNSNYIKIDTNNDGEIQNSEASLVTSLNISGGNISDLTGIESFTGLMYLDCTVNQITSINPNSISNLRRLFCSYNLLNALNVSNLTNLRELECNFNQLTSLDLSGLSMLMSLKCNSNQLTTINLSGTNLGTLYCNHNLLTSLTEVDFHQVTWLDVSYNQITSINLSGMVNLYSLNCSNNQISILSLENLTDLGEMNCSYNLITSLQMTNLTNLYTMNCSHNQLSDINTSGLGGMGGFNCSYNNLISLDANIFSNSWFINCSNNQLINLYIKNGSDDEIIQIENNPNLQFICADEGQISSLQSIVNPTTTISSYCSFTPGGDFNTITGHTLFDLNNNGCDVTDSSNPYVKVTINDGSNSGITFTQSNGSYSFYTQAGNFTIAPVVENPEYFNISPANSVVNFPVVDNSNQTQNFCITPNGIHPDLEVVLIPIGNARPGFDAYYKIVYKNKGNVSLSGQINLNFDDTHTDFVSANPVIDSQSGNDLYWPFSNLAPFETRVIDVVLNLNTPTENPPLNAGSVLHFVAQTNFSVGESTPYDNTFELNQNVVNSYDPNTKSCLEGNTIAASEIGKYVHYNINFENIGTSEAINIVVKDTINTHMFDINSLQLLYASHQVETKIRDSIVEFIFRGIHLPPSNGGPIGGHGNVLFKIKTLPTLQVGDEIANTANIFFDYNHPIETNEARSAYANLSQSIFIKDESIDLLPNPTQDKATVSALNALKSIEIYDVQGRLLQTIIDHGKTKTIDLSNYSRGIYWVKINTEKGSAVQKLIKE